jgi:hypothetical protein
VKVETGDSISYAYVKVFKLEEDSPDGLERMRKRVARDYAATERAYRGLLAHDGLSAVRPIAFFPEDLAIVTEEATGISLDEVLRRSAIWRAKGERLERLKRVFARIGRWVKAFQTIGEPGKQISLDDMRQYLDVRLVKLVNVNSASFDESDRRRALHFFDATRGEIKEGDLVEVLIHADLSPGNILVDGERITVLDFAMAKTGPVYHDLTHLFIHIERLKAKPWLRLDVTTALQNTLLQGFAPSIESGQPLFKLLLLQHTICHLLQLGAPAGKPLVRLQRWHLWNRDRRFLNRLIA